MRKQVNSLLSGRIVNKECQCWVNAQHSRWECPGITRIPSKVKADVLEGKVVKIFEKLGCNIPPKCIGACHRVSENRATVIVKF